MTNKNVIDILQEKCTATAPDRFAALDFADAEKYKGTTPRISPKKSYFAAAAIYAAACIVVLIAIPFIIGTDTDPHKPNPAVSGDVTTEPYHDDTVYDFGGEEFVILCDQLSEPMLINKDIAYLEDDLDDPDMNTRYVISQKMAERFEAAEEKYGINITFENVYEPVRETVARAQAGQTTHNAVMERGVEYADAVLEGYFYDLSEIETIDLTKNYWLPSVSESLTIADRQFFAGGMISFDSIRYSDFVIFNNDLVKSLELSSPYDLVRSDLWTFDSFADMMLAAQKDLDGDGEIGKNDIHGGYYAGDIIAKLWQEPLCTKQSDNTYKVVWYTEKIVAAYQKYQPKLSDVEYAFEGYTQIWDFEYIDNVVHEKFRKDQALFMPNEYLVDEIDLLNGMMDNWGIVPYPVLESGDAYYTEMSLSSNLIAVPSGVKDAETTGMILDYIAFASEDILYGEYYDLCEKNEQYGQDNKDMLKEILDSSVYDWTNIFVPAEYDIKEKILTSGSFASVAKRYADKIQDIIDDTVEKIKAVSYDRISTDEEDVVYGYRDLFMRTSDYVPDAEEKNSYAMEYMYNSAKVGEITVMPELSVMLESSVPRLLAVSFTGFEADEAVFVDADTLMKALVGDKEYEVPSFAKKMGYKQKIPENEIVIYMTADQFREIQPPEGMKVYAGLAEFPGNSSISSLLTTMDSDDTAMTHLYIDLYDYMTYDDALTPSSDDKWEIFKYEVERYYDREIPQEYRDMLDSGMIYESLAKTAEEYCTIGEYSIIPELCKIQMRIDKNTLTKLENQHTNSRNHYILKAK